MLNSKVFLLAISSSFFLSLSSQSIAYLRVDTILQELPGYQKHIQENDSLKNYYSEEVKAENEKLTNRINNLFSKYNPREGESVDQIVARFSESDKTTFLLMQKETEMLEEKTKSYNQLLTLNYNENVQPLLDKLNLVVEECAQKNKLDMVFILEEVGPQLAYVNQKKDITVEIIKKIK